MKPSITHTYTNHCFLTSLSLLFLLLNDFPSWMRKIATSCPFHFILFARSTNTEVFWKCHGMRRSMSDKWLYNDFKQRILTHIHTHKMIWSKKMYRRKERMTRWILKGNYLFDNFPLVFHLSFFPSFFHIKLYWIIYDFILYQELMHFWVIFGIINFCSHRSHTQFNNHQTSIHALHFNLFLSLFLYSLHNISSIT